MPQPDYTIRQNDSGEAITAILKDAAGEPVDLTDATVVFQLARIGGGGLVVEAEADVGDDDGAVSYTWQADDTAAAGWYLASWRVTIDGVIQTYPLGTYTLVQIVGELGAIPAATAPTALWPPVGWTVSPLGELTLSPDSTDGDVIALKLRKATGGGDFVELVFTDGTGDDDFDWAKLYNHTFWMVGDDSSTTWFAFGGSSNWFSGPEGAIPLGVAPGGAVLDPSAGVGESAFAWGVKPGGQEFLADSPAIADGDVLDGQRVQWFDATENAPTSRFKHRDTAGNLHSGRSASLVDDATAFTGITKPLLAASPTVAQISTVLAGLGLTRQT